MPHADAPSPCAALAFRRPNLFHFASLATVVACIGAAGCGDSPGKVAVHGQVTYRGETITDGSVTFFPETGRPVFASLTEDGQYAAELPPGEYAVTINPSNPVPPGYREGDPLPPPKIVLPPKYTTRIRSQLTAVVAADADQRLDFQLD